MQSFLGHRYGSYRDLFYLISNKHPDHSSRKEYSASILEYVLSISYFMKLTCALHELIDRVDESIKKDLVSFLNVLFLPENLHSDVQHIWMGFSVA